MPSTAYAAAPAASREPLHAILVPLGASQFFAALLTDLAYTRTFSTQWETFSVWLVTGGLLVAALAALALLLDLATRATRRISWPKFAVFAAAVVLSIFNAFVHSRDGYTAVAPTGIALSLFVCILLVVGGWGGWSLNAAPEAR